MKRRMTWLAPRAWRRPAVTESTTGFYKLTPITGKHATATENDYTGRQ